MRRILQLLHLGYRLRGEVRVEAEVSLSYKSRGIKVEAEWKNECMPTEVERAFFEKASRLGSTELTAQQCTVYVVSR
jgi:hypothetical protein